MGVKRGTIGVLRKGGVGGNHQRGIKGGHQGEGIGGNLKGVSRGAGLLRQLQRDLATFSTHVDNYTTQREKVAK